MIIVKNRELLIPRNENLIGMDLDATSEIRTFKIDRILAGNIDIANYTIVLDVKYSNGTTDVLSLAKDIQDDYIILTLTLTAAIMNAHEGNLWVNIRATSTGGSSWSSAPANFYIVNRVLNPGTVTPSTSLTELEQLEVQVETNEGLRNTAETARATAETSRSTAEGLRVLAEESRVTEEATRAFQETSRVSAETSRRNAETARVAAENAREASFATKSLESEGWAKGTQNGVPVGSGSPYYHNNAKWYSENINGVEVNMTTTTYGEIVSAINAGKVPYILVVTGSGGLSGGDVVTEKLYYAGKKENASNYTWFYFRSPKNEYTAVVQNVESDVPTWTHTAVYDGGVPSGGTQGQVLAKRSGADYDAEWVTNNAYQKPATGIPKNDLSESLQGSVDLADSAYQKPESGIPNTDLSSGVQNSLNKADTALQPGDFTRVASTMAAASWSGSTYSFEGTYPATSYDITVEPASTATSEQYKAFAKAMLAGNALTNVLTAIGTVPTIDIPIIITAMAK